MTLRYLSLEALNFLYRIRKLYQNLKDRGLFEKIVELGMYGVTFRQDDNTEIYYVGCKEKLENSEPVKIIALNIMKKMIIAMFIFI